jgi:hypothetical protein
LICASVTFSWLSDLALEALPSSVKIARLSKVSLSDNPDLLT